MIIARTTFWFFCSFVLWQYLPAAPSEGYVIQWGWTSATGIATPARLVLSNAVSVGAGTGHSLALRGDGTVFGWGGNVFGETLGYKTPGVDLTNGIVRINGEILGSVVSVATGREWSLALKKDGTVVTWGWVEDKVPQLPSSLTNIVAIAAEWSYSWALKHDGTVVGWGSRPSSHDYGRLLAVEHLSNVVAIAIGPGGYNVTRYVALARDGTVSHWGGESEYEDATPPPGLSNVVGIAAGGAHTLALKKDGTILGWGSNEFGQATGVPTTNYSRGLSHYSAGRVMTGGTILTNVVSIAAGRGYSLALKKDGSVVAWGRVSLYPATVPPGLSNVVAIAAGAEDFCLAITTNIAVAERFRQK